MLQNDTSSLYSSDDMGRQSWSQKIWAKSEAEKRSPKHANGRNHVIAKRNKQISACW